MNLESIYSTYRPGSNDFVDAVQNHCDYELTNSETERLGKHAETALAFDRSYQNCTWWRDSVSNKYLNISRLKE